MSEDEWIQELQTVQAPEQDVRWHCAPSISRSPAITQQQMVAPTQSHSATAQSLMHVHGSSLGAARHSISAQPHALGYAHAWPPASDLHPDDSSVSVIRMMNYWPQPYIGISCGNADNSAQYQNTRRSGTFMQDGATEHDNVSTPINAAAQHPTTSAQDMAGLYHNLTTLTEGGSEDMQRAQMHDDIAAHRQNVTASMTKELSANAPAPPQVMVNTRRHDLGGQQLEDAARWDPYFHDHHKEQENLAAAQRGRRHANVDAHTSGGAVMVMRREECGRPSMRFEERKVQHYPRKDRHSKVKTAKGVRDRRIRLSVPTAAQFYDIQDRLGFQQPSRVFEWLMQKAKHAIEQLPPIPADHRTIEKNNAPASEPVAVLSDQPHMHAAMTFDHPHTSMQESALILGVAAASAEGHHTQSRHVMIGSSARDSSSAAFTRLSKDHQQE